MISVGGGGVSVKEVYVLGASVPIMTAIILAKHSTLLLTFKMLNTPSK